jgi:hypothetical protein
MVGFGELLLMPKYTLTYQEKTRSFGVRIRNRLIGWVWGYGDEWHSENRLGMTWAADDLDGAVHCLID